MVKLNETEFATLVAKNGMYSFVILVFNTKSNKWRHRLILDPSQTILNGHSISIDHKQQRLISYGVGNNLTIIDLNNDTLIDSISTNDATKTEMYRNCGTLMVNGNYHIVGR